MTPLWLSSVLGPSQSRVVRVIPKNRPRPNTPDFSSLIAQMNQQQQQANAAGLEQYQNLMKMVEQMNQNVGGLYDRAEGLLSTMGDTEAQRINRTTSQALASSDQDLISRGLGNTTVRGTARRGIRTDADLAHQGLAERVAGAKAGLLQNRAGAAANLGSLTGDFMLSRHHQQPDLGMFTHLLQAASSAPRR